MSIPAKIELLQLYDEFLLQSNGAHCAPSESALIGNSRLTAVNLTMNFSSSLASVASPRKVDNLVGWRTGAKIKVPV